MRTIETIATITQDGKLTIQIPIDIPVGSHRIVLVIDEQVLELEQTQRRTEIDAAFAEMVGDSEYRQEVLDLEAEIAMGQWEALQLAEAEE